MEHNIELRLIKSLTDREIYEGCVGLVRPDLFSDDLEDIMSAIQELHSEFDSGIDIDIVQEHINNKKVTTRAKRYLLGDLIVKIKESEPVTLDISKSFIYTLAKRKQRLDALNTLAQIIEKNEESHESVISMLSELPLEDVEDSEIVSPDLESLGEYYSSANKYPFSIDSMQHYIGGMSKGNLAIVFGRPEIGKSSFIAHMVANFIKFGITVDYYANEEPGRKIMLNIRRAVTAETDKDIANSVILKEDRKDWLNAVQHLTVRQIGTMEIDTIVSRAKKSQPDVIILDQVDKLSLINGRFNATHEKLKALYVRTRELAKTADCLVINVSQASMDADGKNRITYDMLDGSKTGKAGEADIIIGIGKDDFLEDESSDPRDQLRYITVSKNKINGWHGMLRVSFDTHTNQWRNADAENCY